jgi:hypothetical protein
MWGIQLALLLWLTSKGWSLPPPSMYPLGISAWTGLQEEHSQVHHLLEMAVCEDQGLRDLQ